MVVPLIFGRYALGERVAGGGMGTIYRGVDARSGEPVALKRMNAGEQREARFAQEARLLSQLGHPALVRYIEHGCAEDGELYLVMEWLDGEDLDARLSRKRLSMAEACAAIERAGSALAHVHARGVLHRDVKPSNVFLVEGDPARAKLLDLGVARRTSPTFALTNTGAVLGTVAYMAPEQACGERDIDRRADIFALGCILFECLAGRPAFGGDSAVVVLARILGGAHVPPLRTFCREAPAALEDLVHRMLAFDRADRPNDVASVLRQLAEIDRGDAAPASISSRRSLGSTAERRVHIAVLVAGPSEAVDVGATTYAQELEREQVIARSLGARFGADAQALAGGALLFMLTGSGDVTSRIARAAAFALVAAEAYAERRVVLSTGLSEQGWGEQGAGAFDRIGRLLAQARPGSVAVDEPSARLLEERYHLERREEGAFLGLPRASSGEIRSALGSVRPPCVGRAKELALLRATWAECNDEPIARVVLLTGSAGAGKTRLLQELLTTLDASTRVLMARGDPVAAGSSGSLARQLLLAAAGMEASLNPAAREERLREHLVVLGANAAETPRMVVSLGDLAGLREPGVGAQHDPLILRAAMERSVVDWLTLVARAGPLLVVLEDLHWGDEPSVQWIAAAIRAVSASPLMVLAVARPDIEEPLGRLTSDPVLLRLAPLTPKAATRMAHDVLGDDADPAVVVRVVERSGGNAFFLEELLRAVKEGRGEVLPETVLAVVQSRIEPLEPTARRVLQAASVFGETCWEDGVANILGDIVRPEEVSGWFALLRERELLEPRETSRLPGQREHAFRHALVRDAAYAMLPEAVRRAAHGHAASWLESAGETDPRLLLEHFETAGEGARALPHIVRAAHDAMVAGALGVTDVLVGRGLALEPDADTRARLAFLRVQLNAWSGQHAKVMLEARAVRAALSPDDPSWYLAVAGQLYSATMVGDAEHALEAIQLVLAREDPQPVRAVGFAHWLVLAALGFMGAREQAAMLIERLKRLSGDDYFVAWKHGAEGMWHRFFDVRLGADREALRLAGEAAQRTGDVLALMAVLRLHLFALADRGNTAEAAAVDMRMDQLHTRIGLAQHPSRIGGAWSDERIARNPAELLELATPSVDSTQLDAALRGSYACGRACLVLERIPEASSFAARLRAKGGPIGLTLASSLEAEIALIEGQPERAKEAATEGLRIAREQSAFPRAVFHLERSRLAAVRRLVDSDAASLEDLRTAQSEARALLARGVELLTPEERAAFEAGPVVASLRALATS